MYVVANGCRYIIWWKTFVFESRIYLAKGILLILDHIFRFGLEMHIGRGNKPSKTECIFLPPLGFFKSSIHSSSAVGFDSSQVTIPAKKLNEKQKRKQEKKAYDEAN